MKAHDSIEAIDTAVVAFDVIKGIYNICSDFKDAPRQLQDLCEELIALGEIMGRISRTMQFEELSTYNTDQFKSMLSSTRDILKDLQDRCKRPAGGWDSVARYRVKYMFQKHTVEDYRQKLWRRHEYFGVVLSPHGHETIQKLYDKVVESEQNKTQERENLRAWLGVHDYHKTHEQHLASHEPGTSGWFVNGRLKEWVYTTCAAQHVLWLQGKSGSGKSCLSAHAMDEMAGSWGNLEDRVALYYHCSFLDQSSQTLAALLGSLIAQMCDKKPELWEEVRMNRAKALGTIGTSNIARPDELFALFVVFSNHFSYMLIFLDAPDESSESTAVITILGSLVRKHNFLRLCISSTPGLEMKWFTDQGLEYSTVLMDTEGQRKDMVTYITANLNKHKSASSLNNNLKDEIASRLVQKSENSFRYVDSLLKDIASQDRADQIEAAASKLPSQLNTHYREVLQKIPADAQTRVRRLLRWLTVQTRRLTIAELDEAVLVFARKHSLPSVLDQTELLLPGKVNEILKHCGDLVQYDSESQTAYLSHSSVYAYLLSEEVQQTNKLSSLNLGTEADRMMYALSVCAWYLTQTPLQSGYLFDPDLLAQRRRQWPLLNYCAQALPFYWHWVTTRQNGLLMPWLTERLRMLCANRGASGGFYGTYLQEAAPQYIPSPAQAEAPGLGWDFMARFVLAQHGDADLDVASGQSCLTPLQRAAVRGHDALAQHLLARGARVLVPANSDPGLYLQSGLARRQASGQDGQQQQLNEVHRNLTTPQAPGGFVPYTLAVHVMSGLQTGFSNYRGNNMVPFTGETA